MPETNLTDPSGESNDRLDRDAGRKAVCLAPADTPRDLVKAVRDGTVRESGGRP
jgi:hypothetical protein